MVEMWELCGVVHHELLVEMWELCGSVNYVLWLRCGNYVVWSIMNFG